MAATPPSHRIIVVADLQDDSVANRMLPTVTRKLRELLFTEGECQIVKVAPAAETTVPNNDDSDDDDDLQDDENENYNEDGVYVEEWVLGGVTRTVYVALRASHIPHVALARRAAIKRKRSSENNNCDKRSKRAKIEDKKWLKRYQELKLYHKEHGVSLSWFCSIEFFS